MCVVCEMITLLPTHVQVGVFKFRTDYENFYHLNNIVVSTDLVFVRASLFRVSFSYFRFSVTPSIN